MAVGGAFPAVHLVGAFVNLNLSTWQFFAAQLHLAEFYFMLFRVVRYGDLTVFGYDGFSLGNRSEGHTSVCLYGELKVGDCYESFRCVYFVEAIRACLQIDDCACF